MDGSPLYEAHGQADERAVFGLSLSVLLLMLGGVVYLTLRRGFAEVSWQEWVWFAVEGVTPCVLLLWLTWMVHHRAKPWHWVLAMAFAAYWIGYFFQWSFIMPYAQLNGLSMGEMVLKGVGR